MGRLVVPLMIACVLGHVLTNDDHASHARMRRDIGDTAFVVRAPDLVAENIAFDSRDGSFLIGSLHQRRIYRVNPRDGSVRPFAGPAPEFGAVLGMKLDLRSNTLWANTAYSREAPSGQRGRTGSALLEIDASSGVVRAVHAPPDTSRTHLFNDLVVGDGGEVYLTDSEADAVYVKRQGRDTLALLARGPDDVFGYPNGIAFSPDGRTLLVAHAGGIMVIDPRTGNMRTLETHPDSILGAIDGLYVNGSTLMGVQATRRGEQIVAARLRMRGALPPGVECVRPLVRGHAAFEQPTTGVVVGDTLFYIANSQVRRLDRFDRLAASTKGQSTVILRVLIPHDCP
ncbi:MAG: SMP-30/gluconolactonase/LRE family protein [Gemmatimonadetes bacterium]|nr:SMP-30/gluconolactonase/LRE family protein [Gemmatimonadota bacterium]